MPPAALRDKLTALPDSVQTRLASFLSKRDVAALSRCNRTIFGYVGQQLWKHVEIGWDDIGSLVPGRLAGVSSIKFVHIKADDARPPPQGYLDLANAIINVLAKDQLLGLTQVSPPSAKRFTSSSPCSASRVASFRCQDFAQLYRSQARVEIVTIPNLWAFDPAVIQAPEKIKTLVIHHMPDDHESANALVRLLRAATNVERLHIHADLVDIDPTFAIGESWADLLRAKTITDRNFLPQVHTLAFEGVNFDREGRDAKRLFSLWKMRTLLFRDCGGLGALLPTHYEHGSSDVDAELESLRIIRGSNMPALYPLHDFLGRCPFLVEVTITWAEDIPLPCIRRLATPFLRRLYLFAPAHQGTFAAANADVWKQFVRKAPALKSLAFPFAEVAQCDLSVPPGGFWETRSDGLPFSFMVCGTSLTFAVVADIV